MRPKFCLDHLATGAILLAAVRTGSAVGQATKEIMNAGGLLSDEIDSELIRSNIDKPACTNGFYWTNSRARCRRPRSASNAERERHAVLNFEFSVFISC